MKTSVLFNAPIECLEHHPDNPRKDLGNLEELTLSIEEQGVLQNLSIVPKTWENFWDDTITEMTPEEIVRRINDYEDSFYVLIGNRRFEASKAAGLSEVPARIITGLTDSEQLGIMLTENMQRNDLTLPEEVYGFQRMIDLGESAEKISDQTGLSRATVYHRLNIAKLDKDAVADAIENKQISLTDFIELEKISDIETRNNILKNNPSDIKWAVRRQIEKEEHEAWKKLLFSAIQKEYILEAMPAGAQTWRDGWKYVTVFNYGDEIDVSNLPEENLFWREGYSGISIYYQGEEEEDSEAEKARKKRNEEIKTLSALQEELKESVGEFIAHMIESGSGSASRKEEALHAWWMYCVDHDVELQFDMDTFTNMADDIYADSLIDKCDSADDYESRLKDIVYEWRYDFQAAVLVYEFVKDYCHIVRTWGGGEWNEEDAADWSGFIGVLEDFYSFELDKKFESLLAGTHKFFKTEDDND